MAVAKRSALSVRPRYVLAVVAIGTGLAASGGCKHHRYGAMRPKFVGPATVVPVEPYPAHGITAPAFEDEAVTPPSLLSPADPAARPGLREALRLEPSPADPAARPGLREAPRLEPSPADPVAPPPSQMRLTGRCWRRPHVVAGNPARGSRHAAGDPGDAADPVRQRPERPVPAAEGGSLVAVHRPAPPRPARGGLSRGRPRAPPGSARRGAAITSSSATGRVARTARSRSPGAGATGAGALTPRRQDAGRRRLRHRHLPGGQPRPGRPDAEADRGRPVAGRLP